MPLSPKAQQIVDAAGARFAGSMSQTPVAELRAMLNAGSVTPTTVIHERFDLAVPAPHGSIPVRVYRPSAASDLPVVMWLHSGGFVVGGLDQNDEYLRRLSNSAQVIVVSVDYRLAPENRYPAAIEDARTVWDWIVAGPAELGADTRRAVVAGESAGGSLTFALSQQLKDDQAPMPTAQISLYGAAVTRVSNPECTTSLLSPQDCEWFWDQYASEPADHLEPGMSPALASDVTSLPPTFVATAEVDPTRDATEEYARRLAEAGVSVELHRYDGMMHGFATMIAALEPAAALFDQIVDFIVRSVRGREMDRTRSK